MQYNFAKLDGWKEVRYEKDTMYILYLHVIMRISYIIIIISNT